MTARISQKKELRERGRARRAELARARPDFAQRIARFADDLPVSENTTVAGYRAVGDEADPAQLLEALAARGHEICYPRIHIKAQPLWFHAPLPGEAWQDGAFRIPEPRPHWPRAFPSVFLLPLLAFDAEGYRLGYGGGYYDRTLAEARAERTVIAIGIAFAGQEVPRVPRDAGDERLDMVVTEQGVRRFPKA